MHHFFFHFTHIYICATSVDTTSNTNTPILLLLLLLLLLHIFFYYYYNYYNWYFKKAIFQLNKRKRKSLTCIVHLGVSHASVNTEIKDSVKRIIIMSARYNDIINNDTRQNENFLIFWNISCLFAYSKIRCYQCNQCELKWNIL